MKTKLLKKLRKAAKKAYILISNYPNVEIYAYRSNKYKRWICCDTLKEAIIYLKKYRRKSIEEAIKKIKDKKLNKQFRQI